MTLTHILLLIILITVLWVGLIEITENLQHRHDDDNLNSSTLLPNVIKSPADTKREYRALELANKMKVIVITEPDTDKAAAALNVMVGSLHDPDELPGMAHYLEHLLFLGTEKYPGEDDFGKYLAQHAGASNAYTLDDATCYYVSLSPDSLEGALDRLAQFFISPLFDQNGNEREVNAVHSEHESHIGDDFSRKQRINRFLTNSSHPYRRFTTGNRHTLWTGPLERSMDVRTELVKFFEAHYSASVMSLVVIGRESLDSLQLMVEKYFGLVQNRNVITPQYAFSPWRPDDLQRRIDIVPIMDIRRLYLIFPTPDYTPFYKTGPFEYIKSLIEHGGPGSLRSLLRRRQWASSLNAYSIVPGKGFASLNLEINLTPKGLQNIDEIVLHIFQYMEMLRKMGIQKWFWEELKTVKETEFKFKEYQEAEAVVVDMAGNMANYPIDQVLTANHILTDYQPEVIMHFLTFLVPTNVRLITQARENEDKATDREAFFGVDYAYRKIEESVIQRWANCGLHDELKLPPANEFIATVFTLKPRDNYTGTTPRIILDDEMSRLWYLQDQEFSLPRASITLDIINPHTSQSARNESLQDLYVSLVNDFVSEQLYPASKTGLNYLILGKSTGILIEVDGYDDKIGILFDQVLGFLLNFTTFDPDPGSFDNVKDVYIRSLKNRKDEDPFLHAEQYFKNLMYSQGFSYEQRLEESIDLTLEDVLSYARTIFSSVRLQWLIHGNMVLSESLQVYENGLKHFRRIGAQPSIETPPIFTQVRLPIGSNYIYKGQEVAHTLQSAVHLYFQSEMVDLREEWVILKVMDQIVSEPCFDVLRTKEQLGYDVSCGRRKHGSAFGVYEISIQGENQPNYTESRIHHFLQLMALTVNNLTNEEFIAHKNSTRTVITSEKPKTMDTKLTAIQQEIYRGTYDFDRETQELGKLDLISLDQVQHFFNTWINPASDKRKVLSIHVASKEPSSVMDVDQVEDDDDDDAEYIKSQELVEDVAEWRRLLGFFPIPMPYTDIPPWKNRTV